MRETLQHITAEKVGFNLAQEARVTARTMRESPTVLEIAARNIRTYEAETLEDHVVSYFPYFRNSYNGENRLFRLNSKIEEDLVIKVIDPQERGGAVVEGFTKLEQDMSKISTGFFLWISPRGPAGSEGVYKNISYRYHQVYIGEITKDTVDAYALKADIDEARLSEWVHLVSRGEKSPDPKNAESFIKSPVVLSCLDGENAITKSLLTLRTILSVAGRNQFYKDTTVDEVFSLMKKQGMKQEEEVRQLRDRLSYELSGFHTGGEAHMGEVLGRHMIALYSRYQDERGNVPLKGCVGGSISINQLFGSRLTQESGGVFSSMYRVASVGAATISESCNKISCKKCNWEASDEDVQRIQKGDLKACPKCGWKP